MIIYKATNLINNKVYIGLTIRSLARRKWHHLNDAKRHAYKSMFHAAIRKYGEDSFDWKTIRLAKTINELKQLEIEEIAKHKSNQPEFGYNMTIGGDTPPPEFGKQSKCGKDNPFYGRTHSPETKQKLHDINVGKCAGDKNYFYDKHYTGSQNPFYGKIQPESVKKLIADTNSKEFKVTTKDGNSFIIKNLHDFCRDNNLNYGGAKSAARTGYLFNKKYRFTRLV